MRIYLNLMLYVIRCKLFFKMMLNKCYYLLVSVQVYEMQDTIHSHPFHALLNQYCYT